MGYKMDTRKKRIRGYFTLSVLLILCLCLVSAVVYIAPNSFNNTQMSVEDGDQQSYELLASSTTSSYGTFANKSKYTFTDKDKISAYRSSADGSGTDITSIEVDLSATHGSQTNPYVIDNFNGWTKFVNDMQENSSTSFTYGQGKYYVLAVDLDFNNKSAQPIYAFGGTLYGLGHTISNWNYTENTSEDGTGLIRYSFWGEDSEVVVSDLNMDNYQINDAGKDNGAFIGGAYAEKTWVLNCHSKGNITRTVNKNTWLNAAGIIGAIKWAGLNTGKYAVNVVAYRCSADVNVSVIDSSIPSDYTVDAGGIIGYQWYGCNLEVYDCYANVVQTLTISNAIAGVYSGGIVGYASIGKRQGLGGSVKISGCVSKIVNNLANATGFFWYLGGLAAFYEDPNANAAATSNIEDIYVSGTVYGGTGVGAAKTWAWIARRSSGGTNSNGMGILKSSGDLYYAGETTPDGMWPWTTAGRYQGNMASGSKSATLLGTATTDGDAQLWSTAKNATALKSKIWTQKANIGSTYTIQNSPVINKFDTKTFTITYKDAQKDGNDTVIGTSTYNYPSIPGLTQQANKSGKTFMGYTFDRTSTANPFKTITDSNFYGNVDLYAVWDVLDSDVTKNIQISGGTEDGSGTIVADYGNVIILTADVKCSAMGSNANIEYEWRKGSQVVTTGNNLSIANVADSGTYTLYYKMHSSQEPLWGFDSWRSVGTKTVKINGKTPKFNPSNFAVTSTAYVGMPMKDIQVFTEFLDDTNTPFVGGAITWNGGANAKIDKDALVEKDGKFYYKTKMTYTPDSTQNSAYANYSEVTVDVEFEVVYPKFVFNMEGITTPITVNAEYGQRYTKAHIANNFEKEFLKNLAAGTDAAYNKVKSLEPCFAGVKISDYRKDNSDVLVEGNVEISVTFEDVEYTVTFIYKDENGSSQTHIEQRKYGDNLTRSWLEVPFGYVVNPWRFTDNNGTQREWRFEEDEDGNPMDQVTGDVTLESELRELKLTLQSLDVTPRGSYAAMTRLDGSNLSVVANYLTDDNKPYVINLSSGNGINNSFKVTVIDSPDGLLHVNNNKITVMHTYNGIPITEELTLVVTPVSVDTSNCGWETNVRIKYGDTITLPTVKRLPDGVVGQPTYKYFQGSKEIDKEDIVGDPDRSVTYTIRAIFETEDDYVAEDLVSQLTIAPTFNEEVKKPVFVAGSMTYNGLEQTVVLDGFNPDIMTMSLTSSAKDADTYTVRVTLTDNNYKFEDGSTSVDIDWTIDKATLSIIWDKFSFEHDGSIKQPKIKQIDGLVNGESVDITTEFAYIGDLDKSEVKSYSITAVATDASTWTANYKLSGEVRSYVILPAGMANATLVIVEWEGTRFVFNDTVQHPTATVKDMSGNVLDITLTYSESYYSSKYAGEYTVTVSVESPYFVLEGGECKYTIVLDENGNGAAPTEPGDNGEDEDFAKVGEFVKKWWQVIASAVSIILIIAFVSKGASYASKRKQNKRTIESKYSTFYAAGLFGLSMTNWTIIASVLMGGAVLSLVFMIIEKSGYKKSQRNLDDARDEYERNQKDAENRRRDEQMQMMLMQMMGGAGSMNGNGQQGGFAYAQQGLGAEEIRGIVSETMTALLPGMQQMLPQQASTNDELVQKLIEQNEKNEERIEKLISKLAEKQPVEKVVEREVAPANISDEALEKLASKLQPGVIDERTLKVITQGRQNDETIKKMLENQEKLMQKILELSANQTAEKEVVEKIVEVPVEKIVEKEVKVEVPVEVEKIVEKEVPVEVEKVVEKIVEVPVEKIVEVPIEVEKVVEKIVEIPAVKPTPKAKTSAPRLTLDEAYEKLSGKQKKIFDTLKDYAMSKDKCKEKKSTYYILLGQSSVNPLVKLTIKKDTTVALFKMEDEYMKDIRRNATSDGTKVKVKETELVVGDAQALATAKEMIDLREDQIERYNDYLKEQRSMKKR